MKTNHPVYALICSNDGAEDRPIIMESYVDETKQQLEARARKFNDHYGECWLVELPINTTQSVQKIAGSINKITVLNT